MTKVRLLESNRSMAVFPLVLTLHTFQCCNPPLKHPILTLMIVDDFKKNQAPLLRAEYKLGESPSQDPESPVKASNFRHISEGHLCGKVTEVSAVLAELQPTQLWPHY